MELENQVIEPIVEPVVETVSTEEVPAVEDWKAPASKEELEKLLKAESNKTFTRALKELGVNSVKEFKELQSKVESERTNIESIVQEKDKYANEIKDISAKYNKLVQDKILDELNIEEEYREDLMKLAQDKVSDQTPLSEVLKEMVAGKYKYTLANKGPVKMGTEKTDRVATEPTVSDALAKKYPWIKG